MNEKTPNLTLSKLEQYLSKAAWILKGPVDASDFKVYIFPLLFFKRISDEYHEEFKLALEESDGDTDYALLPEFHRFEIPEGCHWQDVRETTSNVGLKIESAFRGIEQANQDLLYGIFGDAQWSNKEKLSDALLIDLIEHFSQHNLSNKNVHSDILGQAYEYLIKHFADLVNKKAGEFYTPRSVVHLMGLILDPQEGESIYDPACGTGGMFLECINLVKEHSKDYRTLSIYGQEKNLTSSTIVRMNMLLHDVDDFQISRGDTLKNPAFFEADGLKTFDCVIANPPFSLKKWGIEIWKNDPYGRAFAGLPPDSYGDFAWVQHMLHSMKKNTGRIGVVLSSGALFRNTEKLIRQNIIQNHDFLVAVIQIGSNIFYGATIAPCILIFKHTKSKSEKNNVLFINASEIYQSGRAQNYLLDSHVNKILKIYKEREEIQFISKIVTLSELSKQDWNLSISRYIEPKSKENSIPLKQTIYEQDKMMKIVEIMLIIKLKSF